MISILLKLPRCTPCILILLWTSFLFSNVICWKLNLFWKSYPQILSNFLRFCLNEEETSGVGRSVGKAGILDRSLWIVSKTPWPFTLNHGGSQKWWCMLPGDGLSNTEGKKKKKNTVYRHRAKLRDFLFWFGKRGDVCWTSQSGIAEKRSEIIWSVLENLIYYLLSFCITINAITLDNLIFA